MPQAADEVLTERQRKWFASVRESILRETGRSVEEWAVLARECPATGHRARLLWMKETYGLGQNRASVILNAAFPPDSGWSTPEALAEALWTDPGSKGIADAVRAVVLPWPDVLETQRKAFTAFSRAVQFAAMRPEKNGALRLGLAVPPDTDPRLLPAKSEGWSERLKSVAVIANPAGVDADIAALLRSAWEGAPQFAPHQGNMWHGPGNPD